MLFPFTAQVFILLIVFTLGYLVAWYPRKSLPSNEQLSLTNRLYREKAKSYADLLHDAQAGLDQIGHLTAAFQISQPNADFDALIASIDRLQKSIAAREVEGGLLRPTEEALSNPFEVGSMGH